MPSVPPKTSPGAQNMKTGPVGLSTAEDTGPDALGTAENESRRKTWKRDPTPSIPPKSCLGAQNMKTGPDALDTAENESGRATDENGTVRPFFTCSTPPAGDDGMRKKDTEISPKRVFI
jgi:hypothetical protein